jgi:hypothetical protein
MWDLCTGIQEKNNLKFQSELLDKKQGLIQ